jgi:hypothetical protein
MIPSISQPKFLDPSKSTGFLGSNLRPMTTFVNQGSIDRNSLDIFEDDDSDQAPGPGSYFKAEQS